MQKTALYNRVSSTKQFTQKSQAETQEKIVRGYSKRNKFKLISIKGDRFSREKIK
ncbi:MAG: hypothetical protein JW991_03810 [Candidatus Pacebacteria bacterium]|nr:hypothetical protein [Candidatus Paceibacterota bacterium]